jgi:hypothetical protein
MRIRVHNVCAFVSTCVCMPDHVCKRWLQPVPIVYVCGYLCALSVYVCLDVRMYHLYACMIYMYEVYVRVYVSLYHRLYACMYV